MLLKENFVIKIHTGDGGYDNNHDVFKGGDNDDNEGLWIWSPKSTIMLFSI